MMMRIERPMILGKIADSAIKNGMRRDSFPFASHSF
jgi:hypothetical protein